MTTPTPPLSPAAEKIAWSQCPARDGFKCVPPCPPCRKHGAAALIAAADRQRDLLPDVLRRRGFAAGIEAGAAFLEALAAELFGPTLVEPPQLLTVIEHIADTDESANLFPASHGM